MRILNRNFLRFSTLGLVITTLLSLTLLSCSDDEGPTFMPNLPAKGGRNVRGISHSGKPMTSYDWMFIYSNNRIISATGEIRDSQLDIDKSYRYTSNLKYGYNNIAINNSDRKPVQVTLNTEGFISNMKVGRDTYNFIYNNGRLVAWLRKSFEENFGNAIEHKTSGTINYNNDNLSSITISDLEMDKQLMTTTFEPSNIVNRNGLLPEAASRQMGCLGFEHLYYAGLLGLPTKNLIRSFTVSYPEGNKESYTINFEYSVEGNDVTLCNYRTSNGDIASVRYDY